MTNLKRIRLERGYSLRALGEEVGCSGNAVFTWEHGRNRPHPHHGKQLSDTLGLPLDLLLAPDDRA